MVSTTPALSSPEITRDSGLIQKSVSSHEDKVEQYKESHFSQKKQSQFANAEKDNRKRANTEDRQKTVTLIWNQKRKLKIIKPLRENSCKRNVHKLLTLRD